MIPFKYDQEPFFIDSNMNKVSKDHKKSILEIPMPTISKFQPPIWHTAGYMFGWKYLKKKLKVILDRENPFFYLIHPADFLDEKDLDKRYSLALERMNKIQYKEKINNLENILQYIISNGYKGVRLVDIAKNYKINGN